MSFERFFELIDKTFLGKIVERQMEIIEKTDPGQIYVENIRSFFKLPRRAAKWLCDLAVREGIFEHYYAILCPDCERVISKAISVDEIPTELICEVCEYRGRGHFQFRGAECRVLDAYRLRGNNDY